MEGLSILGFSGKAFTNYKHVDGNKWLCTRPIQGQSYVNRLWRLMSSQKIHCSSYTTMEDYARTQKSFFCMVITHGSLPIDRKHTHPVVHNPHYPQCGLATTLEHLYWFVPLPSLMWEWVEPFYGQLLLAAIF